MEKMRWMSGLAVLVAVGQIGCIGSSYRPVSRGTAKMTYEGSSAALQVGETTAPVSPFDSEYVDLFEGEPHALAESSRTQRITGFTLKMVGVAGTIAALFIPEDLSDLYEVDTTRGQIGLGVLIGAAVISSIGGLFDVSANVKLNDAVNMHNDHYIAGLAAAQSAGARPEPAVLPPPFPMPVETAPTPPAPAPAPEPAPAPAPQAAPQAAPAAP